MDNSLSRTPIRTQFKITQFQTRSSIKS